MFVFVVFVVIVCCLFQVRCRLLYAVYCLLFVVDWSLLVVCCVWLLCVVVCCVLLVVCGCSCLFVVAFLVCLLFVR